MTANYIQSARRATKEVMRTLGRGVSLIREQAGSGYNTALSAKEGGQRVVQTGRGYTYTSRTSDDFTPLINHEGLACVLSPFQTDGETPLMTPQVNDFLDVGGREYRIVVVGSVGDLRNPSFWAVGLTN